MPRQKRNSIIGVALPITLGLLIIVTLSLYLTHRFFPDYVSPIIDVDKQAKINEYMEKNGNITADGISRINGSLSYDTFRVYCENTYYGQRGRYAYASVFCAKYSWRYLYNEVFSFDSEGRAIPDNRRPIRITREIHQGETESVPTRFLIADDDNFTILGFDQPVHDKDNSEQSEEIFPLNISTTYDGESSRSCRARQRFYDDSKDVPKPTAIEEIYGQKNSTIVYGNDNIELCPQ